MAKNGKSKKNVVKVDMTDVEVKVLVPEGDYHAKVAEVPEVNDGNAAQYISWKFKIIDDDKKLNGQMLFYNTSLAPQALWNLRNLLTTMGISVPSSAVELDLDEYVGLELVVHVEHEEYEGKQKARITDFTALEETAEVEKEESADEEETEEETEEEEEAEDEEETVTYSADDIKGLDEKGIKEIIAKHKLEVDIAGLEKKPKKRAAMVIDALEKAELLW